MSGTAFVDVQPFVIVGILAMLKQLKLTNVGPATAMELAFGPWLKPADRGQRFGQKFLARYRLVGADAALAGPRLTNG